MPHFNWNRPSPHCSHAAEIFYFRLICIHLNAGNMYILYIHTGASNLFIINDDVVSFFYLLHLYVSFDGDIHLACVASVSVRAGRESWDESKKKHLFFLLPL